MYVAVGAVSFYGLLLTQGRADDLLEDVGQDVRGCTLTETQKSEALTSHVRGDVRADVNASQKPSNVCEVVRVPFSDHANAIDRPCAGRDDP
jgi:hypothetical protein